MQPRPRYRVAARSQNIIAPIEINRKRDADIIAKVEHVLGEAKAGELKSIAIIAVGFNGGTTSTFVTGGELLKLKGAVDYLQYRLSTFYDLA